MTIRRPSSSSVEVVQAKGRCSPTGCRSEQNNNTVSGLSVLDTEGNTSIVDIQDHISVLNLEVNALIGVIQNQFSVLNLEVNALIGVIQNHISVLD